MKYAEMKAIVKGATEDGKTFANELLFRMLPPNEGESYYGTGYYMTVKTQCDIDGEKYSGGTALVDVRYERTVDVEILADRYIENFYGKNAKEIVKSFPDTESESR